MSIRDSRKFGHIVAAVSLVAIVYAALSGPLTRLADWAEGSSESYPYPDENYLRFLLPSLFEEQAPQRIFILGASEAREDLLYEQIEEAFAGTHAYQGSVGGGRLVGVLSGLKYLDLEYGHDALPTTIILGITPRFIANIPRGNSAIMESINRYSTDWNVERRNGLPDFLHKGPVESLAAALRFRSKQHARYLPALCATALHALQRSTPSLADMSAADAGPARDLSGRAPDWILERLYFCRAPYRYHGRNAGVTTERAQEWLTSPTSFWPSVHRWDPYVDRAMVERQMGELLRFTRKHRIALYIVDMPEHPANRAQYRLDYQRRYQEVVRRVIGDTPFLDLRTMLGADDYIDHAHADIDAAERVTARTIDFIKRVSLMGVPTAHSGAGQPRGAR